MRGASLGSGSNGQQLIDERPNYQIPKGLPMESNLESKDMNVCQWMGFGILLLTFMFLLSFIIYQASTWDKVRINRYG